MGKRQRFKKVPLQRQTEECGSNGARLDQWVDVRQVYVRAVPTKSSESIQRNVRTPQKFYDVEIKFAAGIQSGDRIAWKGGYIEFNGTPMNMDESDCRCRMLEVSGIWIEPCPSNEAQTQNKGCGCG